MAARDKRPGFFHRWLIHNGRFFNDESAEFVAQLPHRIRTGVRHLFRTTFTCGCTPGREFRGHRAWNAHHLARHGGYRAGKAARGMSQKAARARDAVRHHARGTREAYGLIDQRGRRTDRARSRPRPEPGRVTGAADLRAMHRHDRDHEKALRHDRKADGHEARGRPARAQRHRDAAAGLRDRHPQPARAVPVPAGTRTAPDGGNGREPSRMTWQAPDGHPNGRPAPSPGRAARTR